MRVRAVYGAMVLPELQATFAGGCLLITAINLPTDRGLERHVARALRGFSQAGGGRSKEKARGSFKDAFLARTLCMQLEKLIQITRQRWEGSGTVIISGERSTD